MQTDEITADEYEVYRRTGKLPSRLDPNRKECTRISVEFFGMKIPKELSPNWSPRVNAAWAIRKRHADLLAREAVHALRNVRDLVMIEPVTIHWEVFLAKHQKKQDRNNLLGGGLKRLQDEIVRSGIISDDNPGVLLDSTVEQFSRGEHNREPGVRVTLRSKSPAAKS